jgi:NADH-quinone oxidoreductase subunit G
VCPVGALTSRDFRFKARVWFLRTANGVCNGCATGCNSYVDYDPRQNRVYRLRPRDNADVNKHWMCDDGMMTYHAIHEGRVTQPRIRNGETRATSTVEALKLASSSLAKANGAKLAIVLSAQFSSEDNLVLAQFARAVLGAQRFYLGARGGWEGDAILRSSDNNPNRAGALAAAGGASVGSLSDLLADAQSGAIEGFIALGGAVAETGAMLSPLHKLQTGITLASNVGPLEEVAHLVIPVTSFAEMDGTFINAKGMAQRFSRAIQPAQGVAPAWQTLIELAKLMSKPLALRDLGEVRGALPRERQEASR